MDQQQLVIQKWSILWRSIILSSLGKTLFPYCKYIKVLDLRDFNSMLDDDMFRGQIMTYANLWLLSSEQH